MAEEKESDEEYYTEEECAIFYLQKRWQLEILQKKPLTILNNLVQYLM